MTALLAAVFNKFHNLQHNLISVMHMKYYEVLVNMIHNNEFCNK